MGIDPKSSPELATLLGLEPSNNRDTLLVDRVGSRRCTRQEKMKEKRKKLAKWLKEGFLRLGPTFIKIGQQFSTRVDILAQEYVDQLAELQVCYHKQ